jgi:hypothetical protein
MAACGANQPSCGWERNPTNLLSLWSARGAGDLIDIDGRTKGMQGVACLRYDSVCNGVKERRCWRMNLRLQRSRQLPQAVNKYYKDNAEMPTRANNGQGKKENKMESRPHQ